MIKPNKYQDIIIKDDGSGYYMINYYNSHNEKPCLPKEADMTITIEYDNNDNFISSRHGYASGASIIPKNLPWLK
jgi:hypothetical protein